MLAALPPPVGERHTTCSLRYLPLPRVMRLPPYPCWQLDSPLPIGRDPQLSVTSCGVRSAALSIVSDPDTSPGLRRHAYDEADRVGIATVTPFAPTSNGFEREGAPAIVRCRPAQRHPERANYEGRHLSLNPVTTRKIP